MASFNFETDSLHVHREKSFVVLGSKERRNDELLAVKMTNTVLSGIDGAWGTLGWENDERPFQLNGTIHFSEEGNTDEAADGKGRHELTQREIEDLKSISPMLDGKTGVVRERYINFDDVTFELPAIFNPAEDLPRLRLTLFLRPDEGALVYYQHSRKGDHTDNEAVFQYIMHEGNEYNLHDRQDYYFPVQPEFELVPVDMDKGLYRQSGEPTGLSFIIKILTFEQQIATEKSLYQESLNYINHKSHLKSIAKMQNPVTSGAILYELVGKEKYKLWLFRAASATGEVSFQSDEDGKYYGGYFDEVTEAAQVDVSKRTLLLIHGTFVDTMKSFKDVILRKGPGATEPSYLQNLLSSGEFDQVLAFDHPTISHDAKQNTEWLVDKFNSLGLSFENKPLCVFTTSRGALVAEYMAADPACRNILPMEKVLMFSAANGSGYFTAGRYISMAVGIWRNSASGPAAKVALTIAKLSIDFFLKQPGCVQMTIGSSSLTSILESHPNNPGLIYKCVVSDWNKSLAASDGWVARFGKTAADAAIKVILGREHDWVIGAKRQDIVPAGSQQQRAASEYRQSIHGGYLRLNYVRDIDGNLLADPHQSIAGFF